MKIPKLGILAGAFAITAVSKISEKIATTKADLNRSPQEDVYTADFNLNINREAFLTLLSETNSDNSDFSVFENTIKDNFDTLTSFGKDGLPLSYPRIDFVKNLDRILSKLSSEERSSILSKLNIEFSHTPFSGRVVGYNGIINLKELDLNNKTQKCVYDECTKFLFKNKIETGNKELDDSLNAMIKGMPEFVNCIGKKQHSDQDYSVDIHSLAVLCHILNDERYTKLSKEDKLVLKLTALLHDIGKAEAKRAPEHPSISKHLVLGFIDELNLSPGLKKRTINSIGDHQWLQRYNLSGASSEMINDQLERYESVADYTMALIFTKADLASTSKHINDAFSPLLDDIPQAPIRTAVLKKFNLEGKF